VLETRRHHGGVQRCRIARAPQRPIDQASRERVASTHPIDADLKGRQQGYGLGERMEIEHDGVELLAGVHNGHTFGAPVALRVGNRGRVGDRDDAAAAMTVPRPGHADLAGALKYRLVDLHWVAERASTRETAGYEPKTFTKEVRRSKPSNASSQGGSCRWPSKSR
jgi:hypothetical protein